MEGIGDYEEWMSGPKLNPQPPSQIAWALGVGNWELTDSVYFPPGFPVAGGVALVVFCAGVFGK